jgi:hypothetical protein
MLPAVRLAQRPVQASVSGPAWGLASAPVLAWVSEWEWVSGLALAWELELELAWELELEWVSALEWALEWALGWASALELASELVLEWVWGLVSALALACNSLPRPHSH